MRRLSRRRFLSVSAAAFACTGTTVSGDAPVARWRGVALGARCSLQLSGVGMQAAVPVFDAVRAELDRLEKIFSLYRPGSEISLLNSRGRLDAPSPDLLALLAYCDHLHAETEGAFDPSVQPLFAAYANALGENRPPKKSEIDAAHALVGWDHVSYDSKSVRFARPGVSLTLNGIAQGYITDQIASLLRRFHLNNVMIDMGEISARGRAVDGAAWNVGIVDHEGFVLRRLTLSDRALATSSPSGTVLDSAGRIGHILDPRSGASANIASLISVSAPNAVLADGISTALCVTQRKSRARLLRAFPTARIELVG